MEIAGVNKISLYENVSIQYTFPDFAKISEISAIRNSGTIDILDFCVDVKFSRKIERGANNKQLKNDTIEFFIQDFTEENDLIVKRLQRNRTGYIAKIEFLSGELLVLQTPFFFNKTLKEYNSNSFVLSATYRVQSKEIDFNFVEGLGFPVQNLFTSNIDFINYKAIDSISNNNAGLVDLAYFDGEIGATTLNLSFDNGFIESSDNPKTITVNGTVPFVGGLYGEHNSAASFTGTNYISFSNPETVDKYTISGWIKQTASAPGYLINNNFGDISGTPLQFVGNIAIQVNYVNSNTRLAILYNADSSFFYGGTLDLGYQIGDYIHIALALDSINKIIKVYANGKDVTNLIDYSSPFNVNDVSKIQPLPIQTYRAGARGDAVSTACDIYTLIIRNYFISQEELSFEASSISQMFVFGYDLYRLSVSPFNELKIPLNANGTTRNPSYTVSGYDFIETINQNGNRFLNTGISLKQPTEIELINNDINGEYFINGVPKTLSFAEVKAAILNNDYITATNETDQLIEGLQLLSQ